MSRAFNCFHKKPEPANIQEIIRGGNFTAVSHIKAEVYIRYHLHLFAKFHFVKYHFYI